MRRARGSITIFLALVLTCLFSAVFALLEAARVCGLKANAQMSTVQARDAVLASYDRALWQEYHLLFWQSPEGDLPELAALEQLQQETIEGNETEDLLLRKNYYMLQVHMTEAVSDAYQLATDDGGAAFREEAAEVMKSQIGEEALRSVLDVMNGWEEKDDNQDNLEDQAERALQELENAASADAGANSRGEDGLGSAKKEGAESAADTAGPGVQETSPSGENPSVQMSENPLEWVKKIKKNGMLALILPEENISEKAIDLNTCIGKRELETGNMQPQEDGIDMEKLLFRLYLNKYFHAVSDPVEDHALDYELEYIIVGKDTDAANLKGVIRRLLLIREASNLAYLETDSSKQQEAAAIASALVLAVGHPELEPIVKQGILAAWAYAESISDIRILVEGGKVSLVKTQEQWHTDIKSLSTSTEEADASKQDRGFSYKNYLQLLMWTMRDQKLAQRAMDLIEKNTDTKMDQMIARAECSYTYEASRLFWNYVTLHQGTFQVYQFEDEGIISFVP